MANHTGRHPRDYQSYFWIYSDIDNAPLINPESGMQDGTLRDLLCAHPSFRPRDCLDERAPLAKIHDGWHITFAEQQSPRPAKTHQQGRFEIPPQHIKEFDDLSRVADAVRQAFLCFRQQTLTLRGKGLRVVFTQADKATLWLGFDDASHAAFNRLYQKLSVYLADAGFHDIRARTGRELHVTLGLTDFTGNNALKGFFKEAVENRFSSLKTGLIDVPYLSIGQSFYKREGGHRHFEREVARIYCDGRKPVWLVQNPLDAANQNEFLNKPTRRQRHAKIG